MNQQDLIAHAGEDMTKTKKGPAAAKALAADDLSEMFGIDIVQTPVRHKSRRRT